MSPPTLLPAAILALAFLVQAPNLSEITSSGPRPIGAGGFPVTFMHASAWFAHRADSKTKELTLMVYLEGNPGWHDRPTDFKWEINQSPARIDMSVGDTAIHIAYWPATANVDIQGHSFNLHSSNVFLVENIDGPNPSVKALGIHDLSFAPDDNPAISLLERNAQVRAALSGQPQRENPPQPHALGMEEAEAWDARGLTLLRSGNPEDDKRACELFRKAAIKGFAPSQYRLGYCYASGRGVKQDAAIANQWYDKAANQGHVDAQYKLGHSYRVGRGVELNLVTALQWYKKAAENGDGEAQHNVGWMYATGQGVEANAEEAFAWFLRAARSGVPGSQYEVARRLREGDGVARDLVSSYTWALVLRAQAKSLTPEAWKQVQELIHSLEAELDETTQAKADELSQEWLRTLARQYIESLGGR